MNPIQKKIAAAVAGAACAAVWAPRLLQGNAATSTSGQVAAGPTEEEMAAMEASVDVAGPGPGAGATTTQVNLTPTPGADPRESLQGLLGSLQNFGSGHAPQSLDQLAGAWRPSDQGPDAGSLATTMNGPAFGSADALQDYLDANPFRGTFLFSDEAIALLGPNAVRVGQELLEGDAVIASIEPQKLTISYRGIPREFVLPPLRATARSAGGAAQGSLDLGAGAAMGVDPTDTAPPPPSD